MLDGLDSVDWRGLEVADRERSGAEVPKMLRRIGRADATTRRQAVDRAYIDLWDLLVAAEGVTDASTAALPFMVELALDPDTVARPDLIDLLAQLAGDGAAGAGGRTRDAGLRRCALDEGWRLLLDRPGAAAPLLPVAAGMLADPDDDVRYKAVHLLAVLGRRAAPYADRLAALLDDPGESESFDGTVGDLACWALTRIGDPRALPGLVERLVAPYRDMRGRCYRPSDPRRPDVVDVLRPLRAHAALLLPAVREALRDEVARRGWLVGELREVLQAWSEDPLLPGEEAPYPPAWQPPPLDSEQAEAAVLAFAAGGDRYGEFRSALASLTGHGRRPAPAVRGAGGPAGRGTAAVAVPRPPGVPRRRGDPPGDRRGAGPALTAPLRGCLAGPAGADVMAAARAVG
ncbi:HEAT repeat domain-containing protein [Streptomyces goshikiensis]|uniref:HEAT repeat domain-containing protein n=1 Tax=Streptomyces goshikiensis TaxID=1942 RepID=UPI00367DCED7